MLSNFKPPSDVLVDLHGSKRFTFREGYRIELFAESFNTLNRQNITAENGTAYTIGTSEKTNTLTATYPAGLRHQLEEQ